ncbi:Gfo/Idh/MocA family oxidoreductase [Actinocrispum sp. NPDC049592]|uniref:Gfo/Idh/MocA family protein n=1 Tax=Actinocrispum sp. NPDC049592 TaxID=3154835 RepID=UPI00342D99C5
MVGWGIVATGGIAEIVVSDMRLVDGVDVRAVSSRDTARAESFAREHAIPSSYGDHHGVIDDPSVDVVYVATPHSGHFEVTRDALLAGKAVLCEKPLTVSLAAAEELVALARKQGVFLMEAMWTRFNPLVRRLRRLVRDGAIGQIHSVHADFGVQFPYDPEHRLWNLELGGGSLLDLGVYPVAFAQMLLGEPETVVANGTLRNGVDSEAGLLLKYENGVFAHLYSSLVTLKDVGATVVGTDGQLELPPFFYRPTDLILRRPGREPVIESLQLEGNGYEFEIAEVTQRILAGDTESPEMPLDDTLAVMRILTEALRQVGVVYPATVR